MHIYTKQWELNNGVSFILVVFAETQSEALENQCAHHHDNLNNHSKEQAPS